jgi:Uma2 family endonuclease
MEILSSFSSSFKSKMTREQFDFLVLSNEDIKIERDKFGTIILHPPITLNSGHDEGEAFFHLKYWTKKNPTLGYAYSPSTSFNMANGVQLGWLIDPKKKMAWIYRNGASEPQEIIGFENILYGEGALLGFEFDLREML